jgi:cell division protein FtsB
MGGYFSTRRLVDDSFFDSTFVFISISKDAFSLVILCMIKPFFQDFLSKVLAVLSLVLAIWIGNATMKEVNRGRRIQEEITALQAESVSTQKENSLLRQKIQYLQTDHFQSKEAKEKLNYQGVDEQVVVIQSKSRGVPETLVAIDTPDVRAHDLLPNYLKWWHQFTE